MNMIKRLLNMENIDSISQKDDTVKSLSDLYQKSLNEIENSIENSIEKGLEEILKKAGFKDLDTMIDSLKQDQIIVSCNMSPEHSPQRIYRVYINKKLFAEMQVDFITSLEKYKMQVTYKTTYF